MGLALALALCESRLFSYLGRACQKALFIITGIPAAAKLDSETGFSVQHKKCGAGTVGLPVCITWAVHFDDGEIHTYTEAQLREKCGVFEVTLGMPVQHKERGAGTVEVDATGQVHYDLENFLVECKKKRSGFVLFRQRIR